MHFPNKPVSLLFVISIAAVIFLSVRSYLSSYPSVEIPGWEKGSKREALRYLNAPIKLLPENFCDQYKLLLIIIHSAPQYGAKRALIRQTWGKLRAALSLAERTEMYFLLGTTPDSAVQYQVIQENDHYQDIIQEDFLDTYNNLTLKSVMTLKLATLFCYHSTSYVLKSDDDSFVNIRNIVKMLSRTQPQDLLMGYLVCKGRPRRDPRVKWYIPDYLYSEEFFPSFLTGHAYLMSVQVARTLYMKALETPMIHLEDVYVTGILAEKAGIRPKHSVLFSLMKNASDGGRCWMKKLYAIYDVNDEVMREAFDVVVNGVSDDCERKYSTFAWVLSSFFKSRDNPFRYRKNCM